MTLPFAIPKLSHIAIGVLASALVVQTVRLEGLSVFGVGVEGAIPRGDRLQIQYDTVLKWITDQARANKAEEKRVAADAKRIDEDANEKTAWSAPVVERYIVDNRVQDCPVVREYRAPAEDNSAAGTDGVRETPKLDAPGVAVRVAVFAEDVRICTENTVKAEAAYDFGQTLNQ